MARFPLFLGLLIGCSASSTEPVVTEVAVPTPSNSSPSVAPSELAPSASPMPSASEAPTLGPLGRARVQSAQVNTQTIAMAIELWRTMHADACPSFADLLRDQAISPRTSEKDPWGQPFTIECSDAVVRVQSAGPDRTPGTPDDIHSQDP